MSVLFELSLSDMVLISKHNLLPYRAGGERVNYRVTIDLGEPSSICYSVCPHDKHRREQASILCNSILAVIEPIVHILRANREEDELVSRSLYRCRRNGVELEISTILCPIIQQVISTLNFRAGFLQQNVDRHGPKLQNRVRAGCGSWVQIPWWQHAC